MTRNLGDTVLTYNKAFAAFSCPGARMMKMHTKEGPQFYVIPGGRVEDADAARIMQRTNVEQFDDGLFPGNPQSWRIGK